MRPRLAPRSRARLPRAATLAALAALLGAAGCRSGLPGGGGGAPAREDVRPPETARELVTRMHERWSGKWYRTLRYTQENTITAAGRETKSEWLVQQSVPGRQRVDFLPVAQRSGVLFTDNVQRIFSAGRATDTRTLVNALVLLGADVYATPPGFTVRMVDSLGIDTTKFYATRGVRQMYVVGAAPGDTVSNQFWVDGDSLLLRRFVQRSTRSGRTTVSDTRFTYQDVGGFPVPREVTFLRNGQPYQRQLFTDVQVNVPLAPELFDPTRWAGAPRP
jgi:hypothetical protein